MSQGVFKMLTYILEMTSSCQVEIKITFFIPGVTKLYISLAKNSILKIIVLFVNLVTTQLSKGTFSRNLPILY